MCQGDTCTEINGDGISECDLILGCGRETHLACDDTQCFEVAGEGANQCTGEIDCASHTVCAGLMCVLAEGFGTNDCFFGDSIFDTCSLSTNSSRPRRTFVPKIPPCLTNLSCDEGTYCDDDGVCRSGCRNDRDCPLGQCVDRSCTVCTNESECAGSRCERNVCEECRSNIDCPDGFQCLDGGCAKILEVELTCGNGRKDTGEECDDGNNSNADCCTNFCAKSLACVKSAFLCGDGVLSDGEECDDSNRRDNDGCSSTCALEIGICGDGVVQTLLGEQCEQSTHDPRLSYSCLRCRFLSRTCGDGTVDAGEECDRGPLNSSSPNSVCRPDCSSSRCGDGIIDSAEECDDSNRLQRDGCDRFCRIERPGSIPQSPTQVAGQRQQFPNFPQFMQNPFAPNQQQNPYQYGQSQFGFPQYPNYQQLPYQLPLAQLQPFVQSQGPAGDTGPAGVAVIGAGAAAGLSWVRRRKK